MGHFPTHNTPRRSTGLKRACWGADGHVAVLSPQAVDQGNLKAERPVRVEKIL